MQCVLDSVVVLSHDGTNVYAHARFVGHGIDIYAPMQAPRVTIVVAPIGPEPLGFGFH